MDADRIKHRRRDASDPVECAVCGAETVEPRRGLCIRCYRRLRRQSPALGGTCELCGVTDQRLLRAVRTQAATLCLCHNCGWIAERYCPDPTDLQTLRSFVRPLGDRRQGTDRRATTRRRSERRSGVDERRREPRIIDKGDRRLGRDRRTRSGGLDR